MTTQSATISTFLKQKTINKLSLKEKRIYYLQQFSKLKLATEPTSEIRYTRTSLDQVSTSNRRD
jgi:hypothetical protein